MNLGLMDIAVILLGQIVAAVAVIVSTKVDVKWLKKWTEDHAKQDEANFEDVRSRLSNLHG
jgi:hypothetical protein